MNRIAITDESGRWFDMDNARKFVEDADWDGSNQISKATGSQWNHEDLYRTASGRWVLNWWSQVQGSAESYTEIDDAEAAKWFIKNEYEDDEIPAKLLAVVKTEIDALEL